MANIPLANAHEQMRMTGKPYQLGALDDFSTGLVYYFITLLFERVKLVRLCSMRNRRMTVLSITTTIRPAHEDQE